MLLWPPPEEQTRGPEASLSSHTPKTMVVEANGLLPEPQSAHLDHGYRKRGAKGAGGTPFLAFGGGA